MSVNTKKVVVVGDGACGKTCLLMVYVKNEFPREYIPTVFDNHLKEAIIDDTKVPLLLMDTAGQEDYERLRVLQYLDTDVFILCFSIECRLSFKNVTAIWMPEIRKLKRPIILVGTKSDLRYFNNNSKEDVSLVSPKEGEVLARKIKAKGYVECSSKYGKNVNDVFALAARAALKEHDKNPTHCSLM